MAPACPKRLTVESSPLNRLLGTGDADSFRMNTFDAQTYWDDRHTRKYGPESVGYAGLGVPYNIWMYRVRGRVVERQVRKAGIDLATRDILDIGSGTGFYIRLWSRLGGQSITGSDFSPFAVASLREEFPSRRFVDLDITATALPAELGQYDVVSAFDILYHIVDDRAYRRAISNIRSLVRPGGYFIFSENFLSKDRETGIHQVSRTFSEIAALLAENGFADVVRAPVFVLMNRPLKSSNALLALTWRFIVRITRMTHRPYLGRWLGALLYPIDLVCSRLMSTGPSTEMMICRLRA
jgi:SAM-dependent methyltransferase